MPVLYGFSPAILPKPRDWPENVHICGHWALDEGLGWQPPRELLEFLQAGAPPVYVGFGSMVSRNPGETTMLVREALKLCGARAVVARGWDRQGGQAGTDGQVFEIEQAPHDWLFPKMAAVVHHGGIGTTTAALKAGVPNIIVPFNYDQPFWGNIVYRQGVGPKPIPRQKLTAATLAKAIEESLTDGAMREKAAEMGRQIRMEDGVGNAVRWIDEYLGGR